MSCKKCNIALGTIILRKKDTYCKECFMINTNHKFRACIGKNKILSRNEHVLVCASGGQASTVLLDLIQSGLGQDIHKKLRIQPKVLHIIESLDKKDEVIAESVISQCKRHSIDVYIIYITEYFNSNTVLLDPFTVPNINLDKASKLDQLTKTLQPTALNDSLLKIKRNLFVRVAKLLGCNHIFTAETTTTLAVNLLSNLAIGRGSQVENDIGFCDSRSNSTKLLRPMKDISNEELNYYMKIKQLKLVNTAQTKFQDNSIHSLIQSFVTNLQDNFPATISTVCKIADKIGGQENKEVSDNCSLCESALDPHNEKLTALQATNFSQKVSHENFQDTSNNMLTSSGTIVSNRETMFPLINKSLCYTCSRIYSEIGYTHTIFPDFSSSNR